MANPNFGEAAYRAAARPTPKKPKPSKPPKKTVAKAPVGQSAAQQIVNAALEPLLASLRSQETSLAGTQAQQQAALKGFTQEILNYLKGTPASIQSDYQGAVDTTRDLAQASADQLLKSNPNSLDQSMLAAINAPQEQRDALAAQNQNVFGGGSSVLFKVGGAIPATAFAEDKANQQAFANALPSIQGLQGQQLFAQLLANQNQDTQKLAAQRAEIEAKRPGLLLDAQKSLAPSDKAPTVKRIGNAYYEWNPSKGWVKLAAYAPTDRYATSTLANGQKVTTLNGQPVGKPWGPVRTKAASTKAPTTKTIDGKVKAYNPATGKWDVLGDAGTGGSSSSLPSVPTIVKNAGNGALEIVTDKVWASAVKGANSEEEAKRIYDSRLSASFKSAMTRVIQAISPQLKQIGYSPAQVKTVAYSIVSSKIRPPKGYKVPTAKTVAATYDVVTPKTGVVTSTPWKATHVTDNLGWGTKTAGDIMAKPGTPVGAPEDGVVVRHGSAQGGQSLYFQGKSGKVYWLGHIDGMVPAGTRVRANERIASISADHANPHLHIDVSGGSV